MINMDKKDKQILEILCKNARTSHNKISKIVKLTKNAVTYRIERLQKQGIITGFATIASHRRLGYSFYELLLKTKVNREKEKELIEFLQKHENVLVIDRFIGEWNFVIEFGLNRIQKLFIILDEIKDKFYDIIELYEIHPIYEAYKVEQLPIDLIKEPKYFTPFKKHYEYYNIDKTIDNTDKKLLYLLNKNTTAPLYMLAKELNITAETVTKRIKKLKEKEEILKFTAIINLEKLGYNLYLIQMKLRNLSKQKEEEIRKYLIKHLNVRYSFLSATSQTIFTYFAVENSNELDRFLRETREKFADIVVEQKYHLWCEQYKYNMFPKGLLEE